MPPGAGVDSSYVMDAEFCKDAVEDAIIRYDTSGIGRHINFYNTRRPHSSLQARTADVVRFDSLPRPSAYAARTPGIHLKSIWICTDEWGQL